MDLAHFSLVLVGAIVGAVGFRLRGSALFAQWTGRGATTARIACWALPLGVLSLANVPVAYAPLVAATAFIGAVPGWYGAFDLGRDNGDVERDVIVMFARGSVWTAPMAAVVWPFDSTAAVALLAAGAACPTVYAVGWATPSNIPHLRRGPEIAEAFFGALIGAAIVL